MVKMLVQSKTREYIKSKGLNTGGDALEALEKALTELIDKAIERAKANNRKTLMGKDI